MFFTIQNFQLDELKNEEVITLILTETSADDCCLRFSPMFSPAELDSSSFQRRLERYNSRKHITFIYIQTEEV